MPVYLLRAGPPVGTRQAGGSVSLLRGWKLIHNPPSGQRIKWEWFLNGVKGMPMCPICGAVVIPGRGQRIHEIHELGEQDQYAYEGYDVDPDEDPGDPFPGLWLCDACPFTGTQEAVEAHERREHCA